MKKIAIKLEITNSSNSNQQIEWFFCETDQEKQEWIDEKEKGKYKWNYQTAGAISTRYYYFGEYEISDLMETDISELKGMKLKHFIELIKPE